MIIVLIIEMAVDSSGGGVGGIHRMAVLLRAIFTANVHALSIRRQFTNLKIVSKIVVFKGYLSFFPLPLLKIYQAGRNEIKKLMSAAVFVCGISQ